MVILENGQQGGVAVGDVTSLVGLDGQVRGRQGEVAVARGHIRGGDEDHVGERRLSHHLKRLTDAGLLSTRSEGTFHYFTADYATLRGLTDYVWEDCCKRGKGTCC